MSYNEKAYRDRERDPDSDRLDHHHSSFASADSPGSEFSLWSDTGDLVDQLAQEADPLAVRLRRSFEEDYHHPPTHRRGRSSQKRVRYASQDGRDKESRAAAGVVRRKEDIRIPSPPPRRVPKAEQILASLLMSSHDGPSRMHGLHGKKLMYVGLDLLRIEM